MCIFTDVFCLCSRKWNRNVSVEVHSRPITIWYLHHPCCKDTTHKSSITFGWDQITFHSVTKKRNTFMKNGVFVSIKEANSRWVANVCTLLSVLFQLKVPVSDSVLAKLEFIHQTFSYSHWKFWQYYDLMYRQEVKISKSLNIKKNKNHVICYVLCNMSQ